MHDLTLNGIFMPGRKYPLHMTMFMKRLITFLITGILLLQAYAYAQEITYSGNNVSLESVFAVIEKQTGYTVFCNKKLLQQSKPVSASVQQMPLEKFLILVLDKQNLRYDKEGISIFIKEKEPTNPQPLRVPAATPVESDQVEQIREIRGKVVDDQSNTPLTGASVSVKNKSTGTSTDAKGDFILRVAPQDILVVSSVGYQEKQVPVNLHTDLQLIRLEVLEESLENVVITGYQKVDKRLFTGSVGKVETEALATAGISDVGKSLQGMVAGVSVENTSGTFGTKSKIRIRGNSSISGNQEPLWVVDGVVIDDPVNINPNQLYSGDAATMLSSAISGINPDDIEDIQILKDASATAMYGTQAVNGVIVISTKKGKVGAPLVSYKNNFSLTMKPSIQNFNLMNSKQRMEFSEELYEKNLIDFTNLNRDYGAFGKLLSQLSRKEITWNEYYDNIQRAKTYNTDWFDVLFNNSLIQEHSISVSSGTDRSQVYMSGSYFRDEGQTIGQNTDRFTTNIRANFKLSNKFTVTGTVYASARNQRTFGTNNSQEDIAGIVTRDYDINPFTYARTTSRAMRPYDDAGNYEYYQMNFAPFNILHELQNNFIDIKLREIKFQLDANWKILNNLTYNSIVSGRLSSANSDHITTERSNVANSYRAMQNNAVRTANTRLYNDPYDESQYKISVLPRGGIVITDNTLGEFYTVRNSLNWKGYISGAHSFDIMAGNEIRHRKYLSDYTKGYGFEYFRGLTSSPDYRALQRDILSGTADPYYGKSQSIHREASFFANLAYSIHNKYNLTLSSRVDGSNRLGTSERFRFLPIWVVGASWNIDDEAFIKNISQIDFMKLRSSYGLRGNISGLGSAEMLAYYGTTTRFDPSTVETVINIAAANNPDMRWEKEKMFNAALEIGLWERVTATLEYYHRKNYDLIGNIEVSRVSGFQRKTVNWADMENSGFEVTLNTTNINHKDFSWNTILTFGYNKNKITKIQTNNTVLLATVDRGAAVLGHPVSGLYSFMFAGLNEQGLPLFYNSRGTATNQISKYSRDLDMLEYQGSREPLGSGGLTNMFRYKRLNVSFLFTYSFGNVIRLNPIMQRYYSDVEALDAELANRWQAPGHELYTNIPRIIEEETRNQLLQASADPFTFYNRSNIRTVDGSFVRLKNIMLNYSLPEAWIRKMGVKGLQLTAQAQNLVLWADPGLNGQDPEALVSGISIPAPRTFTFGLNINL
ncbi:SusC/RagA family TonB-linked outer membrane protein [Gynurincola endophyticus]|uniref:SusC/RagA family TonB-linked outer membrane protein n=1 Tax=Gynurincola endophyticus TaxID=2479004 RepID=UPI000F8D69F3|nr:SusC/RagA family TonB-linked outer membrane protein [Gynurincola endophyticus]